MERKKVALLFISLNQPYWPYLKQVIDDCKKNFLPGHQVDFFAWTDIPDKVTCGQCNAEHESKDYYGATIIPTEPVQWPMPTLMRYHLFLNEEEKLKEYDYIFYLDADMRVVGTVGDEILGDGLTLAEHPMYAVDKKFIPPYEPNRNSSAYVPRFGVVLEDPRTNKPWFKPIYAAGGFQGGTSVEFIKAMKQMKADVDKDFTNNYVAIWNDESHWNKYLWGYSGHLVILSPSYVYPDSLIEEYYVPIWGTRYTPKIITLTKPFTTSKEAGAQLGQTLNQMKALK